MAILNGFLLFAGLSVLIIGTRLCVSRAIQIAHHYQLSDVFIGITILAIGSDLPEIVISINAALVYHFQQIDTSGLIVGNAIGSSFSQIGLIMGVVALFGYLTLSKRLVFRHGGVLLGSILYLMLAALDQQVTRVEGSILVLAFVVYMATLFGQEKQAASEPAENSGNMISAWAVLVLGMAMVIGGSEATVYSTVSLANYFGVPQSFIAIVIIGIGSSLPELTISLSALRQSRVGMSAGNLLGSNIIDTLLPVGLAAMIHPISVEKSLVTVDLPLLFILSFIALAFLLRHRGLQTLGAVVLILFYGTYLVFKSLEYQIVPN